MAPRSGREKALVIGSGMGGMTAAITLARLGRQVTMVEKNHQVGGLMRGYVRQEIDCELGVHYLGALGPGQPLHRIFDFLGILPKIPLEPMGREGVIDRYHLGDFVFDLPAGLDALAGHLRAAFPAEEKQITEIIGIIRDSTRNISSPDTLAGRALIFDLKRDFLPLAGFLRELGCSPRLSQILSVITALVGVPPDRCPLYLWSTTMAYYLLSSWRISCSGGRMAEICAERFRELGGDILTGDEAVRIDVADRRVRGVVLKSGRELRAPLVVAAVHPKILLALLPEGACLPEYGAKIRALEETPGVVCLHAALPESGPRPLPHNLYNLHLENESLPNVSFIQLKRSSRPGWNVLTAIKRSEFSRWTRWEGTRSGSRGREYEEAKAEEAADLLNESRALLGPWPEVRVLDVFTPLSLRDRASSPRGSAYGVMRSVSQKFRTAALHRTPIRGLHLVGQNAMAPGIFGAAFGTIRTLASILGPEQSELWQAFPAPLKTT